MIRAVAVLSLVLAPPVGGQELEKGFEKLFNGENLKGLKVYGESLEAASSWRVAEGRLECRGVPAGYLYTERKYKEFALRFDWKFVRPADLKDDAKFGGNSGYLLWIAEPHKIWPYSMECQGMNRQAGYVYFVDEKHKEKNKFAYDDKARARAVKPVGEWNSYEIVAAKGTVQISINGANVTTVTSHEYQDAGPIGFMSEGSEIHWRNIRIKPE